MEMAAGGEEHDTYLILILKMPKIAELITLIEKKSIKLHAIT